MSIQAAFLEAILANATDDTPRLVYADWLERSALEAQRHQGEFIRLQCDLAKLDQAGPQAALLRAREQELLAAHQLDWLGLAHDELLWGWELTWSRGFVGRAVAKLASVGRRELSVCSACPLVTEIHLAETTVRGAALSELAGLLRLQVLNLTGTPISDVGLVHLAGLHSLRELHLCDTLVTERGVRWLRTTLPDVALSIDFVCY